MADISTKLQAIMDAVYGEEVRGSIHDAIDLINKVGEKNITCGTDVTSTSSSVTGYYDKSLYLNTDTYELWLCDGTKWVSQGIVKGAKGDKGDDGEDGSIVSVDAITTSGTHIADVTIDGETTEIYAPSGGGGGSSVEVTQVLTSGTKIAEISVDGVSKNLYAPKDTNEEITKQKENGYLGSGNLIDCDAEYTPISGVCFSQMPILLKANTDYKVSYYAESGGTNKIIFYNSAKTEITNYRVVYSSGGTVLFSVNCTEEPFYWTLEYSGSGKVSKIQITEGTTYDGYAPYSLSNAELTKKINNLNIIDDTSINTKTTFSSYKVSSMVNNNVLGGDAYNSSTVYSVGDMCIDNNCLYEKIGMAESGFKPSEYASKWKKVTLKSVANTIKYKDITMFGSYDTFLSETWYSYNVGTDADMSGHTILSVFCIYYGVRETNARLHYNINRDNNMFYVNSNVSGRRLEFRFTYI